MAEQLNFQLGLDATPMIQGATAATQQVKTKFDTLHNQIKSTMAQPIQMEIQLKGGKAEQQYQQLTGEIKRAKEAQHQLNLEGIKAKRSAELQRQFGNSVKVSAQQLMQAKAKLQQLLLTKNKNSEAARRLQGEIDKINMKLLQMKPPQGMGGFFQNLVGKMTLAGTAANLLTQAINKIGQGAVGFVQVGAQVEVLKLQLEAFTTSTSHAEQTFSQFAEIAAKTPFDLMQVAQAGKTMMAFGIEADKAVRLTEQLGVVAAGTGGNLNELARNMGQIAAQGQAYTRDLTQFAMQGIPIWEEMSRVTGASVSELKKMASEGKISFDIVEQALSNMTAKGTAFEQIGRQIGDTWIGKMAQLESGVQQFAGAFVEALTNLDSALGGALKSGLQALADGFKGAAENANELVAAMIGIGAGIAVMGIGAFVTMLSNGFIPALRMVVQIKKNWHKVTKALITAKTFLKALSGPAGWASIAAGIGVAVAATKILGDKMNEAAEKTRRLKEEQKQAASQAENTSTALGMTYEEAMNKYEGATQEAITSLKALEAEKANLLKKQVQIEKKYTDMKEAAKTAFGEIQATYKKETGLLNEQIRELQKKKDALNVMGPAQRKLAELSERELRYTARTGEQLKNHISDKERAKLQAQAQLEAMTKQKEQAKIQEKIDEKREKLLDLQTQYAKDKVAHDEKMATYAKDQATEMKNVADSLNTATTRIGELVDAIVNGMQPGLKDAKTDTEGVATEAGKTVQPLNNAATAAGNLSTNLGNAKQNASDLSNILANMPSPPSVPSQPSNFAGGPIKAGTTSYVNELGKEAFLSASGRLSMINAPAWGSWTAPSNGTIIPAHLTKQLDIPTGGINLNKAPGANASVGRAVRTVQAASGDVFNQSVTVQAANPVQAANNIMVEMTRLKRRRFR